MSRPVSLDKSYGPQEWVDPMDYDAFVEARNAAILRAKSAMENGSWYRDIHIETPGKCYRVRRNGSLQLWKTDQYRFRMPVKYGMGPSGGDITQDGANYSYLGIYNAHWHYGDECPNPQRR